MTNEAGALKYQIVEQGGRYGVKIEMRTPFGAQSVTAQALTADLPRAIALLGLLQYTRTTPAQLERLLMSAEAGNGRLEAETGKSSGSCPCMQRW